jgi:RNA polymerase sigma-70 factor, ECF subfamily
MSVVAGMTRYAPGEESDEILIRLIAARNENAMRALYERHKDGVFRFVVRIVKDEPRAEDVASEVFFEVWRRAGTFEARSRVGTWLLGIARFKAWTANRTRRHVSLDDAVVEQIEDEAENPEEALLRLDRGAAIRACLARLSPQHREIIELVYYHEKTITEVADILHVPRNTVKTRMFYARKALQRLMARGIFMAAFIEGSRKIS